MSTSTMKEPRAGWKIARSAYLSNLTPILLPSAIFVIASGIPPSSMTYAEYTRPFSICSCKISQFSLKWSQSGVSLYVRGTSKYTRRWLGPFKSWLTIFLTGAVTAAKDTRVGGTVKSINVPLMESLPPMAPISSSFCALYAPSRAATGLPQDSLECKRSKYSCNVKYASWRRPPSATSFATDKSTAYCAPWYGLQADNSGTKPWVIMLAVVVSPWRTGNLATMPCVGVFWYLPPNGMSTVLAPTVLSKRSAKPCWEAVFNVDIALSHCSLKLSALAEPRRK